mmetsp:Transcript_21954/g.39150  ORF Transcript_21954/g.39150 Transcript_21954/m.39150 type:complete len:404 (-) Transcript_21954:247-1458(-)
MTFAGIFYGGIIRTRHVRFSTLFVIGFFVAGAGGKFSSRVLFFCFFLHVGTGNSDNGFVFTFTFLHGYLECFLHHSRIQCRCCDTGLDTTFGNFLCHLGGLFGGLLHEFTSLFDSLSSEFDRLLHQSLTLANKSTPSLLFGFGRLEFSQTIHNGGVRPASFQSRGGGCLRHCHVDLPDRIGIKQAGVPLPRLFVPYQFNRRFLEQFDFGSTAGRPSFEATVFDGFLFFFRALAAALFVSLAVVLLGMTIFLVVFVMILATIVMIMMTRMMTTIATTMMVSTLGTMRSLRNGFRSLRMFGIILVTFVVVVATKKFFLFPLSGNFFQFLLSLFCLFGRFPCQLYHFIVILTLVPCFIDFMFGVIINMQHRLHFVVFVESNGRDVFREQIECVGRRGLQLLLLLFL